MPHLCFSSLSFSSSSWSVSECPKPQNLRLAWVWTIFGFKGEGGNRTDSMSPKKCKDLTRSHSAGDLDKNISSDTIDGTSNSIVDASTRMDENLWGTLQQYIWLRDHVYIRLPYKDFCNLRVVCKDWYKLFRDYKHWEYRTYWMTGPVPPRPRVPQLIAELGNF